MENSNVKYQSQLEFVKAASEIVAYQYSNPVLCCRCIEGNCKDRKGCSRVKSQNHNLVNQIIQNNVSSESYHFENRSKIWRMHLANQNVKLQIDDKLDFQDNLFLTVTSAKQQKCEIKTFADDLKMLLPKDPKLALTHLRKVLNAMNHNERVKIFKSMGIQV